MFLDAACNKRTPSSLTFQTLSTVWPEFLPASLKEREEEGTRDNGEMMNETTSEITPAFFIETLEKNWDGGLWEAEILAWDLF